MLRNGKEVVVRTWQGTKYTYTAIGKRYFAKQKKEYVIEIPVITDPHRKRGVPEHATAPTPEKLTCRFHISRWAQSSLTPA